MAGTRSSRILASAAIDASSVPLPAIGIVTCADVLSLAISTSVVSIAVFVPAALASSIWIAPATSGLVTSSALTTTVAAAFSPGNAAVMRSNVLMTGVSFGIASMPALAVWRPSVGSASATRMPPETTADEQRAAQDAVEHGGPDARLVTLGHALAEERDAALVDAVAELGEHGGQDGERADHRDADHEDRAGRQSRRSRCRR